MESDEEFGKVVEFIKGEYSVEEDLLLIELLELRRATWDEVTRAYNKKKSQYNKILMYNKEPHAPTFHARLQAMRSAAPDSYEGRRFSLLKKYCMRKDVVEKKEVEKEKSRLKRWHPDKPSGKRQLQKLGHDDLEIVLIGKNFPRTSVVTYRKPLIELSDVIKAMVDKSGGDDHTITLSEKTLKYNNFENFGHFHPDIVMRLILFCVNDVYSAQYEDELSDRHVKYMEKLLAFKVETHQTLDACERYHFRVLAQQKREEQQKEWAHWDAASPLSAFLGTPAPGTSASRPTSSKAASRKPNNSVHNLARADRYNDSTANIPSSGSNSSLDLPDARNRKPHAQKYAKIKHMLQQYYKQQKESISEVVTILIKRHLQKMEDKKSESIQLYNFIFQNKEVARLLILAEDLVCEELRQACIAKISSTIEKFVNAPALRCMLLREETYVSILSRLHVSTLLNIVPGSSIPSSVVKRELAYRKLLLKDQVDKMSFEELQRLTEKYDTNNIHNVEVQSQPFFSMIDIVKEDLAYRKETYPIVVLQHTKLLEGFIVEKDNLTVSATDLQRYCVAHANHSKHCALESDNDSQREIKGKWYFEVTVDIVDPTADGCISIGWDVPRPSLEKCVPGIDPGFDSKHGFMLQLDGIMHYSGKGEYFGPKSDFREGDIIGCGIDQVNNFIHFYKNGLKVLSKTHHGNFAIQPPYEYIPCVCFYTHSKSQVTFNFSGPFHSLPQGFKSYGRAPT